MMPPAYRAGPPSARVHESRALIEPGADGAGAVPIASQSAADCPACMCRRGRGGTTGLTAAERAAIRTRSGLSAEAIDGVPIVLAVLVKRLEWLCSPAPAGWHETNFAYFACPWSTRAPDRRPLLHHGVVDPFELDADGRIDLGHRECGQTHCPVGPASGYVVRVLDLAELPRLRLERYTGELTPIAKGHSS